jgi:hypothetical protein
MCRLLQVRFAREDCDLWLQRSITRTGGREGGSFCECLPRLGAADGLMGCCTWVGTVAEHRVGSWASALVLTFEFGYLVGLLR